MAIVVMRFMFIGAMSLRREIDMLMMSWSSMASTAGRRCGAWVSAPGVA